MYFLDYIPKNSYLCIVSITDAYNVKETITITPDNYLEYL